MNLEHGLCGMGHVKIADHWVDAYYQHHPASATKNDTWVVRVRREDYEAMKGQWGERVRLRLPHEAPRDVKPVSQWFMRPFVWLEFEWSLPVVNVAVDAPEALSGRP